MAEKKETATSNVEVAPVTATKAVTKIDVEQFKKELNASYFKTIKNYLGNNEEKTLKFMSSVIYAINKVEKLLECDKKSLFDAIVQCSQIDLFPGVSGEVRILPFKGKATFILGYQGLVTLLYQAGVDNIYGEIVRENDEFNIQYGTNPGISHKPAITNRGKAIGAYVIIENRGKRVWKFMNKEEIMEHAKKSPSFGTFSTPWKEENDPDLIMWLKTCLKRAGKFLPKNEKVNKALDFDNQSEESISEFQKRRALEEANKPSSNTLASIVESQFAMDEEEKI